MGKYKHVQHNNEAVLWVNGTETEKHHSLLRTLVLKTKGL